MQISSIWLAQLPPMAALQNCLNENYNHRDNASRPRPRPLRRAFAWLSGAATISLTLLPTSSVRNAGGTKIPAQKLIKSDAEDEQELLSRQAYPYIHIISAHIKHQRDRKNVRMTKANNELPNCWDSLFSTSQLPATIEI